MIMMIIFLAILLGCRWTNKMMHQRPPTAKYESLRKAAKAYSYACYRVWLILAQIVRCTRGGRGGESCPSHSRPSFSCVASFCSYIIVIYVEVCLLVPSCPSAFNRETNTRKRLLLCTRFPHEAAHCSSYTAAASFASRLFIYSEYYIISFSYIRAMTLALL